MSGSPEWKVYDAKGVYQAACKAGDAAALLSAFYGAGATIRAGHGAVVWREGTDQAAPVSVVAKTITERKFAQNRAAYDKAHGEGAAARLMAARS